MDLERKSNNIAYMPCDAAVYSVSSWATCGRTGRRAAMFDDRSVGQYPTCLHDHLSNLETKTLEISLSRSRSSVVYYASLPFSVVINVKQCCPRHLVLPRISPARQVWEMEARSRPISAFCQFGRGTSYMIPCLLAEKTGPGSMKAADEYGDVHVL
jgi:hypothetical protein